MSLKRSTLKRFCCDTSLSAKHLGEFWRKMKPLCQLVLVKTHMASSSLRAVVLFPTLGLWPKSLVTTLHGSKRALLLALNGGLTQTKQTATLSQY